jgi:glycosyltransferase involved in cell wall biosynthesis
MPRVSVIIPAYNSERFIGDTISSILNQTFQDFEIIVVDDGSTDGTPQVIQSFGERVRLISQKNKGGTAARNTGVEEAVGEYISFLDHDDLFLPEKLQLQVDFLDGHREFAGVFGWAKIFDETGKTVLKNNQPVESELNLDSMLVYNRIMSFSQVMLRREVFDKVGKLDPRFHIASDYEFWLRMLAAGLTLTSLETFLVSYRVHGQNVSSRSGLFREEHIKVVQEFFAKPTLDPKIAAQKMDVVTSHYLRYGISAYAELNPTEGRRYLQEASQYNPTLFKQTDFLCRTFAGIVPYTENSLGLHPWPDYIQPLVDDLCALAPHPQPLRVKLMGQLYGSLLFIKHDQNDETAVRHYFYQTLTTDLRWLKNKGFMLIGIESLLGRRTTTVLRKVLRGAA